jgi:hypothetical protein
MEPKFALPGSKKQQILKDYCLRCHMLLKFGNCGKIRKDMKDIKRPSTALASKQFPNTTYL